MSARFLFGCAVAVCAAVSPLHADPTGIMYDSFFDGPVLDGLGNEAVEVHNSFGSGPDPSLTFDGVAEKMAGDLIGLAGPTDNFDPANDVWITEMTADLGGTELVEFWIFGDDDGDATPPTEGSFGPLFNNTPGTLGGNGLAFGLINLFWQDTFASDGEFAVVVSSSFSLTFDGGGGTPTPIVPDDVFVGGSGTEDDPFFIAVQFDPLALAGDPTDFHAEFEILHVPEPATLAFLCMALAAAPRRRRPG